MNPHAPKYDHNMICEYYLQGNSITECQKYFGCSSGTVKRSVLKRAKLRTIKEGVSLINKKRKVKHTLSSRIKMSELARKRNATKPKQQRYRDKRSLAIHPKLGITEKAWFSYLLSKHNYTCMVSRVKGCRLAVHHLFSINGYPEKRWLESNVIVIQEKLHKKFHHEFMGNACKSCTPVDFECFLRQWGCSECGVSHDRDVNASRNILLSAQDIVPQSRESHAL